MGIDITVYVMFGTKIAWDHSFNEAYDDVYDDSDTPFVVLESICGEYMVFGKLLWDSGNFRWGLNGGHGFMAIPVNNLSEIEQQYKEQFIKKFPQFAHYMNDEFHILTFTHDH